jgi:hypothetical protein
MKAAYASRGIDSTARVARIDELGARVEVSNERAAPASAATANDARR